tara:strand:- start:515 stop:790 length:276 start_codon:yes stop_codon:yes gene_type:complete
MKTFVWINGKAQSMRKHNDDLIMACAIGCWVKETAFSINQRAIEYQKAFLSSMDSTNRILNTSISGMLSYERRKKEDNKENYKKHAWLLKG